MGLINDFKQKVKQFDDNEKSQYAKETAKEFGDVFQGLAKHATEVTENDTKNNVKKTSGFGPGW